MEENTPATKPAEKAPATKPAEKAPATKPAEKAPAAKPAEKPALAQNNDTVIIFKVQIVASSNNIPTDSEVFQGVQNVESYTDNGMVKYTVGKTTDFDEIGKLKKEMAAKFPQAFIVAFKKGERMDISKALKEYRNYKNNRK